MQITPFLYLTPTKNISTLNFYKNGFPIEFGDSQSSDHFHQSAAIVRGLHIVMRLNFWRSPAVDPSGIIRSQINAAMAARPAKPIVPVSPMESMRL
jgi:hypothetical protein